MLCSFWRSYHGCSFLKLNFPFLSRVAVFPCDCSENSQPAFVISFSTNQSVMKDVVSILQVGSKIAMSHHERWNGEGYPGGIAGEEIPLEGRICAVVDVFDALTSERRYRPRGAIPNREAYEMMAEDRGKYFDPIVLDVFMKKRDAIEEIQNAFRDSPAQNDTLTKGAQRP